MDRHGNKSDGGISLATNNNNNEVFKFNPALNFVPFVALKNSGSPTSSNVSSDSTSTVRPSTCNSTTASSSSESVSRLDGSSNPVLAKQRYEQHHKSSRSSLKHGSPISRPTHQYNSHDISYALHINNMRFSHVGQVSGVVGNGNVPVNVTGLRRSNHINNLNGKVVDVRGMSSRTLHDFNTTASSLQNHCMRSMSTPQVQGPRQIFGAPRVAMAAQATQALEAFLNVGVTVFSVTPDTQKRVRNVHQPDFLRGVKFHSIDDRAWFTKVLPHLEKLELVINSTVDLMFVREMLHSPHLLFLFEAITKVSLPNAHWFSGVSVNRPANPYFKVLVTLPKLESVTFSMHNAGFTDSYFGERHMIRIEPRDSMRSQARKFQNLGIVVAKYGLEGLFECRSLRRLRLEYVECARTVHFTKAGGGAEMMRHIQTFFMDGFFRFGMKVKVEVAKPDRT